MGRRALRKINPTIDLTRHLKTFEDPPRPWSSETLFEREADMEVEVGSGKGLFLRTAAATRPEVNFLASRSPRAMRGSPPRTWLGPGWPTPSW